MRKTIFIIAFLFYNLTTFSQNSGFIKGIVTETSNPVAYANVFLTLANDSTRIIMGVVSDSLGNFFLEKVPSGKYVLNIRMIGFTPKHIPVSISETGEEINLKGISIETDDQVLKTVKVKATRDLIKKTDEGFIVNAADNITQIGGTAADLLKNMPGVLVSAEGEVTLRGKSPLTLINGRISGITGIDRSAQLERIPASSIERIEIINNPSAKYDADAEGGVINIILKKNEDNGTNGAVAIGMGLGDRYRLNASLLLNHKSNRWNVGVAYDNWYTTRTRRVTGDRINFDLSDERFLIQRRFDERLIFYQNAKATVDYTPNKKHSLNFEALWVFPGEDNNETLKNTIETSEENFTSRNQRHSNEIRRSHAIEAAFRYVKHFNTPDKHLSANVSNTFTIDKENTGITTQYLTEQDDALGNSFLQNTHVYQKTNLNSASVDYAQPVGKIGILEMGYKGIFRFLNADFERSNLVNGESVIDLLNSNIFKFNEQIHAVYSQYTGWIGEKETPKWKYNVGLRTEKVWNSGRTQNDSEKFTNNYFYLYPSANLFYYTPKQNSFKLSYSKRITRPGLGQLNPFIDITDSLNQHSGNPRLKPELIHSLEFAYNYLFPKGSVSVSTFYRIRNNAILPYTVLDNNGVALGKPLNFGTAVTYGFEIIAGYSPFASWEINFSLSTYQFHINNQGTSVEVSASQLSWYSKIINNFTVSKNGRLQVIANYTAPIAIPQGKSITVYFVDVGFQQKIWKGKGRIGLVVTDVFNTQKSGFATSDFNFESKRTVKLDTRAIMVTFGYTFGTSFKEKLMENKFQND